MTILPRPPPTGILAQYADGTTLLFRSCHLEIINLRIESYFIKIRTVEKCRIIINPAKSTVVLFAKRRPPTDNLKLDRKDKGGYLSVSFY